MKRTLSGVAILALGIGCSRAPVTPEPIRQERQGADIEPLDPAELQPEIERLVAVREYIPRGAMCVGKGEIVLEYDEPAIPEDLPEIELVTAEDGSTVEVKAREQYVQGHREGWDGCLIQFQWDAEFVYATDLPANALVRGRLAGHTACRARLESLLARFGKQEVRLAFGGYTSRAHE